MRQTFLLIGCVLLATGCATQFEVPNGDDGTRVPLPSDAVRTQELGALMVVSDRGTGSTDAFVVLRGSERNVELVGADALRASVGDTDVALEPRFFESAERTVSYAAVLGALRGPARVTLSRGSEVLESIVELPQPFDLRHVPASAFSRRSEDVVLRWDSSSEGDRMYWYATGDCIELRSEIDVADTGSLVIPRSSWTARPSKGDACDVTIYVRRSRSGRLARAFGGGGKIQGEQVRTVTLSSRP